MKKPIHKSKIRMYQYHVYTKSKIDKIRPIYENFLKEDNQWFYSLYMDHFQLRVSAKNPALEKYFKMKRWRFEGSDYNAAWECGPIVSKYFDQFVPIFHNSSLLVLQDSGDWDDMLERTAHLMLNMMGANYWNESKILANLTLKRAFTAGAVEMEQRYENTTNKTSTRVSKRVK